MAGFPLYHTVPARQYAGVVRGLVTFLLLANLPLVAGTAADIARSIRENSLDRDECYRVRDLTLVKEDIRVYLTDGYLIFSKPVAGRRIAAVFTADVENGDGEVLLFPPTLAERRSLASYVGSPNLDEHFQAAIFFFTGDTYQKLIEQLPANPTNRKVPEMGAILEERYNPVLHDLGASFDTRLTLDLMGGAGRKADLFTALFRSAKLGSFNVLFDPDNPDQIAAGQFAERDRRTYFDVWTHFPARSSRSNPAPFPRPLELSDFHIEATVGPDLNLQAVSRVNVKVAGDGAAVLPFEIASPMTVTKAKLDGRPAEVLKHATATESGAPENDLILVVPPEPLRAGVSYALEFEYSGRVIRETGTRVYYVTARGNWYPTSGPQFASYDLTFRYPRNLELVTPGDVIEDRTEGEWRITRRRPSSPIRLAGFNLGDYVHARVARGSYVVDVCANRSLEMALQPRPQLPAVTSPLGGRRRGAPTVPLELPPPPPPDPLDRLKGLASDIASALDFMASKFGPPALAHLTVSPIPGTFGQGFPGLIYLSTRSYLDPSATRGASSETQFFFDELLQAHETAHQWWGGLVVGASYHDDWLMEALANYSALLYVEKHKGEREMQATLDHYRADLLQKRSNGQTMDSVGPIVLGTRLESSVEPRAWNTITYGKGSWIIQMLRQRMGDERFFPMLAELLKRYRGKDITTEQFRELAAGFLAPKSDDPKLETFFDQWVYGTGIPTLKLSYSIKGKAPSLRLVGTLTQSDVAADFSSLAPVEIQVARGRNIVRWVRSASEPVTFTVPLQQPPLKVTLDPHYAVLRRQ